MLERLLIEASVEDISMNGDTSTNGMSCNRKVPTRTPTLLVIFHELGDAIGGRKARTDTS